MRDTLIAALQKRLQLMVSRAVVKLVNDSLTLQGIQVSVLPEDASRDFERFQEYGFTSVPLPGAQAIVLTVMASPDHPVAIAVDDHRWRKKGLAAGEAALYHKDGAFIHLKNGGEVEIFSPGTVKVNAQEVQLIGDSGAVKGVVQGDCVCAFTGGPHPQTSVKIKASL